MPSEEMFDLFIVGGGINGTGIAADAATRGLKVALCEKNDLASATSSASSKLIHGGLRYLEQYQFRLVKEALAEREVLLNKAPHLIKPLRFILPHQPHLRPAWMIRIGLFMYDHLTKRNQLPGSELLSLDAASPDNPLVATIKKAFAYSDCQADDSRLVIANALQAKENNAEIWVRTECISATREGSYWHITVRDLATQNERHIKAKALVNAAGPWAKSFIESVLTAKSPRNIRLIKGSHFVVRKLYPGNQAYILQNKDHRIVFVIPYEKDFTLIGTTDSVYDGDPKDAAMDTNEENYLLTIVNEHFKQQLKKKHILWRYSGVRPLCDDESDSPSAITRDYTLELETDAANQAPLLSVFGGKLTTFRKLAESALNRLNPFFPAMAPCVTAVNRLPGGDIGAREYPAWHRVVLQQYQWLPPELFDRLCHAYGSRIHTLLLGCKHVNDLGHHFGEGLYQKEVEFLVRTEWARNADDIVWRRSKLGLRLANYQIAALDKFVTELLARVAPNSSQESA